MPCRCCTLCAIQCSRDIICLSQQNVPSLSPPTLARAGEQPVPQLEYQRQQQLKKRLSEPSRASQITSAAAGLHADLAATHGFVAAAAPAAVQRPSSAPAATTTAGAAAARTPAAAATRGRTEPPEIEAVLPRAAPRRSDPIGSCARLGVSATATATGTAITPRSLGGRAVSCPTGVLSALDGSLPSASRATSLPAADKVEGESPPGGWRLLKDGPAQAAVRQIQQQLQWQQQLKHQQTDEFNEEFEQAVAGAAAELDGQGLEPKDAAAVAAEGGSHLRGAADAASCLDRQNSQRQQQQQVGARLVTGPMSSCDAPQQGIEQMERLTRGATLQQQQQHCGTGSPWGRPVGSEAAAPKRGTLRLFCGSFRIQGQ